MTFAIFQAVLTAAACFGVWRFARRQSLIITGGFLIRAFAGQILFWISWLKLPIARSLQLGKGFWFFAIDGPWYLGYAKELIAKGPKAILFAGPQYPSRVFTQAFTVFCAAFGAHASTAILFNCIAYLATCALILRIGKSSKTVALAAIAFGPAPILWSLQPLKDTFFVMLIAALIALCYRWQELWRSADSPRWSSLLACAAAMLAVLYAIAGTRWYLGAIIWALSIVFFALAAIPARSRAFALAAGAVLFVLLSQAFRFGGALDIPDPVRQALAFQPRALIAASVASVPVPVPVAKPVVKVAPAPVPVAQTLLSAPAQTRVSVPHRAAKVAHVHVPAPAPVAAPAPAPAPPPVPLTSYVTASRKGFESTPGATAIHAGAATAPVPVASEVVATFIPRAAAQPLKLVRIGGGRGFWLMADFDTIVFSAVILFAIVYCTRALRSGARITPLFFLVVLVFFAAAAPMIYSVTNFGTLFRLRQMLYVLAAITPLTLLVVNTDAREMHGDVREEQRERDDRRDAHRE